MSTYLLHVTQSMTSFFTITMVVFFIRPCVTRDLAILFLPKFVQFFYPVGKKNG